MLDTVTAAAIKVTGATIFSGRSGNTLSGFQDAVFNLFCQFQILRIIRFGKSFEILQGFIPVYFFLAVANQAVDFTFCRVPARVAG